MSSKSYQMAQAGLVQIKAAIRSVLEESGKEGMRNVDIGRALGISYGHSGRHRDHIPRTLLDIMRHEGVVIQDSKSKKWRLNQ